MPPAPVPVGQVREGGDDEASQSRTTGIRAARHRAPLLAAAVGLAAAVAVLAHLLWDSFYSDTVDLAHHYLLVDWFAREGLQDRSGDPSLGVEMGTYPPGAHVVAAGLGAVLGSTFRGIHLLSALSLAGLWLSIGVITANLPLRRAVLAAVLLGLALLLSSAPGPLQLQVHGHELIGNYFWAQAVGQTAFWLAVAWAVVAQRRGWAFRRTVLPVAVGAVVTTWVHVLPAVQLLCLVGGLCLLEVHSRWTQRRASRSRMWTPLLLPPAVAAVVAVTPGFRAQRAIAAHDGGLDVPYLTTTAHHVVLAAVLAGVALALLLVTSRRRRDGALGVLVVLSLAAFAVSLPALVQSVALAAGEGSPYAVKKHAFALMTAAVLMTCVGIAAAAPVSRRSSPRRADPLARGLLAGLVAVVALVSLFVGRPATLDVSDVAALEAQTARVAQGLDRGLGRPKVYAAALPDSTATLDYMFSISTFQAPRDSVAYSILGLGRAGELPEDALLVTSGASAFADRTCVTSRRGALVIAALPCAIEAAQTCSRSNSLADDTSVVEEQLVGFSGVEAGGRWTDGAEAVFTCRLTEGQVGTPVKISLDVAPFLPPGTARQRVVVTTGMEQRQFTLTAPGPQTLDLVTVPRTRNLAVRLVLRDALSPTEAGAGHDTRELAAFVSAIRLIPVAEVVGRTATPVAPVDQGPPYAERPVP